MKLGKNYRHHFFSNMSYQDVNAMSSLSSSEDLRFWFSKDNSISIPVNAGAHAAPRVCPLDTGVRVTDTLPLLSYTKGLRTTALKLESSFPNHFNCYSHHVSHSVSERLTCCLKAGLSHQQISQWPTCLLVTPDSSIPCPVNSIAHWYSMNNYT